MKEQRYNETYEKPAIMSTFVAAQLTTFNKLDDEGRYDDARSVIVNMITLMFALKERSITYTLLEELLNEEFIIKKYKIKKLLDALKYFKSILNEQRNGHA